MGGKWHQRQALESLIQHSCEVMAEEGRKEKTQNPKACLKMIQATFNEWWNTKGELGGRPAKRKN